ncbi:MAG: GNAT family N-acetyltransferase [Steroidobacteraceae bacterium]
MTLVIAAEDPRAADLRALVAELDAYLASLYPPENNHLLDLDALSAPDVSFLAARDAGAAAGCAALRRLSTGRGEIKRMFVRPAFRGRGVGRALLEAVEMVARVRGVSELLLETGVDQPEAIGLYRSSGFEPCGPYGDYRAHPLNLFLRKPL